MQKWSNIHKIHFKSTHEGYPIIEPTEYIPMEKWIGFNEVLTYKGDKSKTGVYFYIDDYQFERVYNQPKKWANILKDFGAVLTPDFSMFTDFPLPIQKYNFFREHWCGVLWQRLGLTVYPTVGWADKDSFAWCFQGEPRNSTIAVSNIGVTREWQAEFMLGWNEMLKQVKPKRILLFGNKMDLKVENCEIIFIKCGGFHGKSEEKIKNL